MLLFIIVINYILCYTYILAFFAYKSAYYVGLILATSL